MEVLTREIEVEEVNMFKVPVGRYEKSLPPDMSWSEHLATAGQAGYDFVEISIDESNECLSCLDWTASEKTETVLRQSIANTGLKIMTTCLSGHRKYLLGSYSPEFHLKRESCHFEGYFRR